MPIPPLVAAGLPVSRASAPSRTLRRGSRRWIFPAVLALLVGTATAGVLALALSFRFGGGARALREAAMESMPDTWERRFEFGVGRLPVLLAKAGLSQVRMEPEVRAALSTFQSADVGIYGRVSPTGTGPEVAAEGKLLDQLTETMARRGWEPLVRVRDGRQTVAVFLPRNAGTTGVLDVGVLVDDGDQLVIVSARANPDPLIDLALRHQSEIPLAFR